MNLEPGTSELLRIVYTMALREVLRQATEAAVMGMTLVEFVGAQTQVLDTLIAKVES